VGSAPVPAAAAVSEAVTVSVSSLAASAGRVGWPHPLAASAGRIR